MPRMHPAAAFAALLVAGLSAGPVAAQQVVGDTVLFDRAPTVEELHAIFGTTPSDAAQAPADAVDVAPQPRTRGLSRSVVMHGASPAPAATVPARPPASQPPRQQAAAAPAAPAATRARAPEPALPALPELPEGAQQLNVAVFFGFNSAELDPSHEALLESLAAYILEQENSSFVIAGHADAVGSPAYNLLLSQLRASAIKSYLVEDWGIAPDRLEAVGYGEQRMLTDFPPDAPEQRRVAFHMVE